MNTAVKLPAAGRGVVEALARRIADGPHERRPVLLRAAPVWDGPETITIGGNGDTIDVTVRPAATVMAVLDLVDRYDGDGLLIVPTDITESELGETLRAQIHAQRIESIDPWDAIRANAKAEHVDRRLRDRDDRWIAEQLLVYGSEPWKRRTPPRVLAREDVLRRLLGLHLHGDPEAVVDVASMLTWSQVPASLEQWHGLDPELRGHLAGALREVAGQSAAIVTTLADIGEGHDAPAIAVAAEALLSIEDGSTLDRFKQQYFGHHHPEPAALRRFAEAGLAHLQRLGETRPKTAAAAYRRAEELLVIFKAEAAIAESDLFAAGFDARLDTFATALQSAIGKPERAPKAEDAFKRLKEHQLAADRADSIEPAHAALRLLRWLSTDLPEQLPVAGWVDWQIREGGWVDSARAQVRVAETADRPRLGHAYRKVLDKTGERRTHADRRFAARLAAWRYGETEQMLLAENLQERIMRPLADAKGPESAPLLVICDGMSAADATAVGADIIAEGSWVEIGRHDTGREGALATVPSSTVYSRASLLSGRLVSGGQDTERRGFAELWKTRKTAVFHKGDLRAAQTGQIPEALQTALDDRSVVIAVVLNTIDDALDKDDLISRPVWRLAGIDYLRPLLAAASRAARPVVLCSDHGHIRERDNAKSTATGESVRWRSGGEARDGEIVLTGPRVLEGERIVAAVDERIRYRTRKAGYHGGASLAEMVIPVQVYAPSPKARAGHWVVYESTTVHQPEWWNHPVRVTEPQTKPKRGKEPAPAAAPLFEEATLGRRVCESETYRAHVKGVRRIPDPAAVTAIIDAAQAAGGVLASAQVGRIAEKPAASVAGYVSQLQRALNIDGTQVLSRQDDGASVRIDLELLRQQFLGGRR